MHTTPKQSGFSLIEILIGMTIGLIVILVIMQTMSLFEGQRKTSNSAADMQSNGLLALYSLEQDVRLAGYGLIASAKGVGYLPCVKINGYGTTAGVFNAIPLSITTSGVSDIITISRLDANMGGLTTGGNAASVSAVSGIPDQATLLAAAGILTDAPPGLFKVSDVAKTVGMYASGAVNSSNFSYKVVSSPADTVLISYASSVAGVPPLDCSLVNIATASGTAYIPAVVNSGAVAVSAVENNLAVVSSVIAFGQIITNAKDASSVLAFAAVNNSGFDPTQTPVFPAGGYPDNSLLHNLGAAPSLTRTTFATNGTQFTKQINNAAAEVIAEDIVNLQAQYGISNPTAAINPQAIICWVNPTAANTNPANAITCPAGDTADWTPAGLQAVPSNMNRIKAIRVAIVARNNLREKSNKGGVCSTTTTPPVSWLNGPAVDLSTNPEWMCYRYKVYQTIIPLHNVILGNI